MSTVNRLVKLNNGQVMPVIGMGTFVMSGERLQQAVEYALAIGMCHSSNVSVLFSLRIYRLGLFLHMVYSPN